MNSESTPPLIRFEVIGVPGVGEIVEGDDLAAEIHNAAGKAGIGITTGDVVVVTQKVVSKAEGRIVDCSTERDRLDLAIDEASRILRRRDGLVITETRHGFVCANSGVDASNLPEGKAALLPVEPDRSARRIRDRLAELARAEVAVIISDTFGRAWRVGQTDVAIGVAGMLPLADLRGSLDDRGRELTATVVAVADELAGAAELAMGKSFRCPVAIVRGYRYPTGDGSVRELIRRARDDLFR